MLSSAVIKMTAKQIQKASVLVILGLIFAIGIFFVYAMVSDEVETGYVEAAITRDCGVNLSISSNEIAEPGIVFKDYELNGTPMSLICRGANWICDCTGNPQNTPIPSS
jgi:hypothetical protein